MQKNTVAASVMISVTGDVSQIPSMPHNDGKTKIVMSRIKMPRRKAITADCFGQFIDVKYMEPATLNPCTRGDIPSQSLFRSIAVAASRTSQRSRILNNTNGNKPHLQ